MDMYPLPYRFCTKITKDTKEEDGLRRQCTGGGCNSPNILRNIYIYI